MTALAKCVSILCLVGGACSWLFVYGNPAWVQMVFQSFFLLALGCGLWLLADMKKAV